MKIAVLGTGTVGRTLAEKLAKNGHAVVVGTRDPAETLAKNEPGMYGTPPFNVWLREHASVELANYADAARHAEVVINATAGIGSLAALEQAGAANLNGKILIDVANPLDFSRGMPPSLTVCNTDSLAEQIQRAFPNVKVVKALNTMNNALMVNPAMLAGGDHEVFVAGEDAAARQQVADYLRDWFGWQRVTDLGGIRAARGLEMYLPLWLNLMGALQTGLFNIKIVKV